MVTNHNGSASRQNDYELEDAVNTDNYDYAYGRMVSPVSAMQTLPNAQQEVMGAYARPRPTEALGHAKPTQTQYPSP